MTDHFENFETGLTSPVENSLAVTPNDGTDLSTTTRALWVGVAGDINIDTKGGGTVTLKNVAAGSLLPFRVSRVWATGTTATDIVALW